MGLGIGIGLLLAAAGVDSTTPRGLESVVELIHEQRLEQAQQALGEICAAGSERVRDPRCDMIAARIAAEKLPDATSDKERIAHAAEPVLALVRAAGAKAEQNANGLGPLERHFVSGWSAMVEAQMLALSGSYMAAGSASRRAKGELERVLEIEPDHSDAKGLIGAYEYFADRLPRVVKLVKWFLRVPGGNRERGLHYIAQAAGGDGYLHTDMRLLGVVIDANFEGDWERSQPVAFSLAQTYPSNETMAKYAILLARFDPGQWSEGEQLADRSIDQIGRLDQGAARTAVLRLLRSQLRLARGAAVEARSDLEFLLASGVEDPAWAIPQAHLLLGLLALEAGETESVRSHLERARKLGRGRWYPKFLARLEETQVSGERAAAQRSARALLQQIAESAGPGLEAEVRARLESDPAAPLRHFVLGEIERRRGRWEEAERHYRLSLAFRSPDLHLLRYRAKLLWAAASEQLGKTRMAAGIYRDLSIDPVTDPLGKMALQARADLLTAPAAGAGSSKS
ncbi:MAG TPA: hypothetical protein VGB99_10600 [Acidobacteriota bacterium]